MSKITENTIEKFAIELLDRLGYQYIYAPEITPDGERPERTSYEEVLLTERLQNAIGRINPYIPLNAQEEASNLVSQFETLINGMLNKGTLLDLIRHFIVFEKSTCLRADTHRQKKEDPKTGQITISTIKKTGSLSSILRGKQSSRINFKSGRIFGCTDKACPVSITSPVSTLTSPVCVQESPESYGFAGVKSQPRGDRKGGVVWHTQGSGKSLSMVFFTGKIVLALNNPTVLVITDRNDLDDQLFDIFAASTQLLRQEPKQAKDREDLKEKLKVASGGVIFFNYSKIPTRPACAWKHAGRKRKCL